MKQIYIRLIALFCVATMLFSIASSAVALEESEETNVALGKPVVVSYEQGGVEASPAVNAVDGNTNTRWSTYGDTGTMKDKGAIQVDFGKKCELTRLETYWFGGGRDYNINIYVTDVPTFSGNTFTAPSTVTATTTQMGSGEINPASPGSAPTVYEFDRPVTGRYLTIEVTNRVAALWELEAVGTEIDSGPAAIKSIPSFTDRLAQHGTPHENLQLPNTATVTLDDFTTKEFPLIWSCENYDGDTPGDYIFIGTPVLDGKITNPDKMYSTIKVTVLPHGADLSGRHVFKINNDWKFRKGTLSGVQAPEFNDVAWDDINIPHTWNAFDGQDGGNNYYRGDGWYRKNLEWNPNYNDKQIYIEFLGAAMQSDVYVNGTKIGTHKGGYTAFRYDITNALIAYQDNLIAVRVSNSASLAEIAPAASGKSPTTGNEASWRPDFTIFGGIYREVSILITEPVHVDTMDLGSSGLKLTATNVSKTSADLNIKSNIVNESNVEKTVKVKATLKHPDEFVEIEGIKPLFDVSSMSGGGDVTIVEETITIPAGGSEGFSKDINVINPRLWNGTIDPYRYQVDLVVIEADKTVDAITQYVGFRYYEADYEEGFFLNGESYLLRGVSRHQDREDMGNALTTKEHDEDFALIYEVGANTVRLAHYPQAPYFYELCDKYGIVVWAEIAFINNIGGSGTYENPDATRQEFFDLTKLQLQELIRQQYNRPSILFWGLQNEVRAAFDPIMIPFSKELDYLAHAEDPTRLTTQAADTDTCATWTADLNALNKYPGWYESSGNPGALGRIFDEKRAKDPTRPMGISEYGIGASIYQHAYKPTRGSEGSFEPEEYQNYANEIFIQKINERPYLWGTYVWNMFDFSADHRNETEMPGVNTKGLVTRDRTVKKDSFYLYKANWSEDPFVYITSRRHTDWEISNIEIKAYSNCDSVELTVNNTVVGTLTQAELQQETVFVWDNVPLTTGENVIEMKATKDDQTYTDTITWNKVKSSSTEIESTNLVIDDKAKKIKLTQEVLAENLNTIITSKANTTFELFESNGTKKVTSGKIMPGMILRVKAENGIDTSDYTFVAISLSTIKSIEASSFQENDEGTNVASYANDGDSNTRWAAGFVTVGQTSYPQWIRIDLGGVYSLSKIDVSWYQGGNQRCYFYTVSVSNEKNSGYTQVVNRSNNTVSGLVSDSLNGVTGRYVKIDITGNNEFQNNKGAAASIYEIGVYGDSVIKTKTELSDAVSDAEKKLLEKDKYTSDSVLALESAITVAKGVIADESPVQSDINNALNTLRDAIAGLVEVDAFIKGDLDESGDVTVSDIVKLRALIMGDNITEGNILIGDLDGDGKLSVSDIVALRALIMSK